MSHIGFSLNQRTLKFWQSVKYFISFKFEIKFLLKYNSLKLAKLAKGLNVFILLTLKDTISNEGISSIIEISSILLPHKFKFLILSIRSLFTFCAINSLLNFFDISFKLLKNKSAFCPIEVESRHV